MMGDDKSTFSRFVKSICNRQCKQKSPKCSWWKCFCFCRSRFSEEFLIENIYEDLSDIEWNEITKIPYRSRGQSTEQVLVMETNMLSAIPECFPSSSDVETSHINKKRSIFDLKSHDGDIIARKWSPTENWSFGYTAAWDAQEHETVREAADKRSDKRSLTRNGAFREKHAFKKNIFCKKGYKTFQNESELEHSYSSLENEPQSKIKFKTKVLTNTKKRKTKLTSKVQGQFRSSLSSTAEYGKIETSFSFASYVKRGNPHFHSSCTQKFTTYDNVNDTNDLDQPLKHDVTFNPIFQELEEEARDIDPRKYRLYTIVEEPEE